MDSSHTDIKCGLLNVQSAGNKTFEISDLIKENNIDIFAQTETSISG